SLFEVRPQAVVNPKNVEDVKKLVTYVNEHQDSNAGEKRLTLTGRCAGTDMSGGPLTNSIVVSFTKYFNQIKEVVEKSQGNLTKFPDVEISGYAVTEPGVYY